MIYVSESQLDQVEYLIGQSVQGNHILFDTESIRKVFWNGHLEDNDAITLEESYEVEPLIERLIGLPTLAEKRAYLEELSFDTYKRVVRTYFNIVENNIYENMEISH